MVYILLTYFIVTYIYGVITYFNLKNKCSRLRNTGAPGQSCVSPESRTSKCWNSGNELNCSHCMFGFKSADSGGHVCKSNNNLSDDLLSLSTCRYSTSESLLKVDTELLNLSDEESSVKVEYKTRSEYKELPSGQPLQDQEKTIRDEIFETLKENCFYDLRISASVPIQVRCENVNQGGDGICRKDYDGFVREQNIRYRPDKNLDPKLAITKET